MRNATSYHVDDDRAILDDIHRTIVIHGAATLAGLKVGSLFCYRGFVGPLLSHHLESTRRLLAERGVLLHVFRRCERGCQIYIYRPSMLRTLLDDDDVRAFLTSYGYDVDQPTDALVRRLAERFRSDRFPHELGIFLGYPLHDVEGFIRHRGKNYLCAGCWKVYAERERAEAMFQKIKSCRETLLDRYQSGAPLRQLIAA
ncbi:MAG: DUF3793 family protein [Saccharofermentanales bacterium]